MEEEKRVLRIGDKATFHKTIRQADVTLFAGLTADFSRIHVDEEFAKSQRFGRPIVHGVLTASFISTIMGMQLPGSGTLFLDQYVAFKNPVFFDDTITAEVEFTGCVEKTNCYIGEFKGRCLNQRGDVVVTVTAHQMMTKDLFAVAPP